MNEKQGAKDGQITARFVWRATAVLGVLVFLLLATSFWPLVLFLGPPAVLSLAVTWGPYRKSLASGHVFFSKRMLFPATVSLVGSLIWWVILSALWRIFAD
jgi:hypothetical protein